MKINNVELSNLDLYDVDVVEKYEKALEKVVEEARESEHLKGVSAIKKQCAAIFDCFNALFGKGTDKKIFGDKVNLIACLNAFEELVNYAKDQQGELNKIAAKYSNNRVRKNTKK